MGGVAVMIVILAAVMVPAIRICAAGVSQGRNGQDKKQEQNERENTPTFQNKTPPYYHDRDTISEILRFVKY